MWPGSRADPSRSLNGSPASEPLERQRVPEKVPWGALAAWLEECFVQLQEQLTRQQQFQEEQASQQQTASLQLLDANEELKRSLGSLLAQHEHKLMIIERHMSQIALRFGDSPMQPPEDVWSTRSKLPPELLLGAQTHALQEQGLVLREVLKELRNGSSHGFRPPCPQPASEEPMEMGERQDSAILGECDNPATESRTMDSMEQDEPDTPDTRSLWEKVCDVVDSDQFEMLGAGFIVLNSALMATQMQCDGLVLGAQLGGRGTNNGIPAPGWFQFLEIGDYCFTAIFTAELVLRLAVLKWHFFFSAWNFLDFFIVALGIMDLLPLGAFLPLDPMTVRLLRLGKLSRCIKMFKMATWLDTLNLILTSMSNSISTLLWSMLLLFGMQCLTGMVVTQMASQYMQDATALKESRVQMFVYFGTFFRSMVTMFEVTHGNYVPVSRFLEQEMGELWSWLFILYRVAVSFAFVSVIRAVFVSKTLHSAANDPTMLNRMAEKECESRSRRLDQCWRRLLDQAQLQQGPQRTAVSKEAFMNAFLLENPKQPTLKNARASKFTKSKPGGQENLEVWSCQELFMKALNLSGLHLDLGILFDCLNSGETGRLTKTEFLVNCEKLMKQANAVDLFAHMTLTRRLERGMECMEVLPQRKLQPFNAHMSGQFNSDQAGADTAAAAAM